MSTLHSLMIDRRAVLLGATTTTASLVGRVASQPLSSSYIDLHRDFGISGTSLVDVSAVIQKALMTAGNTGGATVICPPGIIFCKRLMLPNNVLLVGSGMGATTLKLPDHANTYLVASQGYIENNIFANSYGGLRDLTLDGNKSNNSSGDLMISRSWRASFVRVAFNNSPRHGLLCSDPSANGTPLNAGQHIADVLVQGCIFSSCNGSGYYGANGANQGLADNTIDTCVVGSCGILGFYGIQIERAAGFKILGCQLFNSGIGELSAFGCGDFHLSNCDIDGTSNRTRVAGTLSSVVLSFGGYGVGIVTGNQFHTTAKIRGNATRWTLLEINTNTDNGGNNGILVSGNSFWSSDIDVTSISYGGRASTSIKLYAPGNSYTKHAPKPSRGNIDTTG